MRMGAATVLAALILAGTAQAEAVGSKWRVETSQDGFTDAVSVSATVQDGIGGGISIACGTSSDSRKLYVIAPSYLGGVPRERAIEYRFDGDPVISDRWNYSGSVALTQDNPSRQFVAHLRAAKRLRVMTVTLTFSPVYGDFDVSGAAEAMAHLDAECAKLGH